MCPVLGNITSNLCKIPGDAYFAIFIDEKTETLEMSTNLPKVMHLVSD